METRAHRDLRLVPWESWQLWNEVRKAVFSTSAEKVTAALNKISAWRARNSLPVAVEVTWDIISIQRTDPHMSCICMENSLSDELLRLMYSMAIMRLINGVVDHVKKPSSLSVADRAEDAGLPRMLVDIRHEVAHQELPSLSYLRLASKEALDWLKVNYWEAQKDVLHNAHKHLQEKLQIYASMYDNPKDKALFQNSRKRSFTFRAKRLADLSGPAVDLLDGCSSGNLTREFMEGETEPEKLFCSDETVDAAFQKGQSELARSRRRLRSVCWSHHVTGITPETDVVETEHDANTMSSDFTCNEHSKIGNGSTKNRQSSLKGAWAIADDWRPCAIGLLPSKVHSAGILPFSATLFTGVETKTDALPVAELVSKKPTLEINALISSDKQIEERSDIVRKRLKTDKEAKIVTDNQEDDSFPSDKSAAANSEGMKRLPHGSLFPDKHRDRLSLGGFLLVGGVYQRCAVEKLEAMRSSVRILK